MHNGPKTLHSILHNARNGRFPLIFVIPGSGQIARYAIEGGAQFLMVLNAGLYRMAGVSSMGSFMPFGNANDQTEELLRTQILPRVRETPLISGLMPNDPTLPINVRFKRLADLGIAGIINWPAAGFIDGRLGQALAEEGFTLQAEIEMLQEAKQRGFVTFAMALSEEDSAAFAASGADVLVLNVGWTHETHDIFEKADRVQYAVVRVNRMLKAIKSTGASPICLFFGGAVLLPEDSAVLYQRTHIHGYGGGSSFERIPIAKVISDSVRKFRSIPRKGDMTGAHEGLGKMVGASPVMNKLYRLIEKVAPHDVSVCIEGESGVGKELVASQLHALSKRSSQPFITLNCGAIPDTLRESEFFGHEKGAFTGAVNRRLGKFELADRGTLFLDEVAELSPKAQVSLLRVLQQKEISRVGGEKAITVDPRIISATHQNLKQLVDQGRFRADLYFRLSAITLHVPPLHQHPHDMPVLVNMLLSELGTQFNRKVIGVSQEFMSRLMRNSWPGNVRELKHVLCRAIILEDGPILRGEDFIPDIGGQADKSTASPISGEPRVMLSTEANSLLNALKSTAGNKSQAAKLLGISRKTLYARLKRANL